MQRATPCAAGGGRLLTEEIRAAGPGGMYIGNEQTLKLMRTGAFLPEVADRERREVWQQRGRLDAHARALRLAKAVLCYPNRGALTPEADRRIRASLDGLVAGESVAPDQWRTPSGTDRRLRRGRRRA